MTKKKEVNKFWPLETLKKYAVFEGRARRKEFWYFFLFYIILESFITTVCFPLLPFFHLALLVPTIAVFVRRLHDRNISGWWMLVSFLPFGLPILLIIAMLAGDEGTNEYGTDPVKD